MDISPLMSHTNLLSLSQTHVAILGQGGQPACSVLVSHGGQIMTLCSAATQGQGV